MDRKYVAYALLGLNLIVLSVLACYVSTDFYHFYPGHRGWGDEFTEVSSGFKILLIIGCIIPVALALASRKIIWLMQPLMIFGLSRYWKEDIFQGTLFINQPSSTARVQRLVKNFVDNDGIWIEGNMRKLNDECMHLINGDSGLTMIYPLNHLPYDEKYLTDTILAANGRIRSHRSVTTYAINAGFIKSDKYKIRCIELNGKQIVRLDIELIEPNKKMYLPTVYFYPAGVASGRDIKDQIVHKLNTHYYLELSGSYIYKGKWQIGLVGPYYHGG